MIRARFYLPEVDDYRPVRWPIKHPYWCTGFDSEMNPIIVAYADNETEILELWPEATDMESEQAGTYQFTSRFPKPKWFKVPKEF